MGRYWRIYRTFVRSSLVRELEFKANFIAKVFQQVMWCVFFVLILFVIYGNTRQIAGWSQGESLVLAATVFLLNGLTSALFFSLLEIPSMVRQGTLDFVATKPVDSQFWISTRRFNFDQIGTVLAGVALLIAGVAQAGARPGPADWLAYAALLGCAVAVFYAFNLMLMTTGIWLVRVDNLWVLSESITNVARFPIDIYTGTARWVLTYAVPLALLATVPSRQLVRGLDPAALALALGWAAGLFLAARLFWRFAIRHYSSASS